MNVKVVIFGAMILFGIVGLIEAVIEEMSFTVAADPVTTDGV